MKQVLSLGAGLQSSAMVILASQGKIQVDEVVFSDTGAEKPETYYYLKHYLEPLFQRSGTPFAKVRNARWTLWEECYTYRMLPSVKWRWCTANHKVRPLLKHIGPDAIMLIGFATDEPQRAERASYKERKRFPLIELGLSSSDCRHIIDDFGWPAPIKSSCFFCPFGRWSEWNWLKLHHPELVEKALELEAHYYTRKPKTRGNVGLFHGGPLWKWANGTQLELPILPEYSCRSGFCGH